ncbi:TRAP transporter small permease [Brevibacterium yomogidense]|uniref:TRAP transporter small permease n=1 Tax=Brevibacterium yomogidense TaxID=946573 RepID=UPI0018E0159F|nr:TRAP transporter small permease [Brevibacterium yomogidense]
MSWSTDDLGTRRFTAEEVLGASLMFAMVLILFAQVVSRFVFANSLSWSEELARYLFIWLIFLCIGTVTLRGEHVAIDIVTDRMPPRARRVTEQVCLAVAFVINAVILIAGFQIAFVLLDLGQTSAALTLPMWVVYAALPIGMTLALVRGVQSSVALWRRPLTPGSGSSANGQVA